MKTHMGYFCSCHQGKKGELESVARHMKLENQIELGWRCARDVALQLTNGQTWAGARMTMSC